MVSWQQQGATESCFKRKTWWTERRWNGCPIAWKPSRQQHWTKEDAGSSSLENGIRRHAIAKK
jgi:hypothetical protein